MGQVVDIAARREEARVERIAFTQEAVSIAGRMLVIEQHLRSLAEELGEKAILARAEVYRLGGEAA